MAYPVRRTRHGRSTARLSAGSAVLAFGIATLVMISVVRLAVAHLMVTMPLLLLLAAIGAVGGRRVVRQLRTVRSRRYAELRTADASRMSPEGFEHHLAALCQRDGCTRVEVVGGAGDLAADVLYTDPHGRRGLIQAKRYREGNHVGSEHVQRVNGTYRDAHRCEHAAIVTTSHFTHAATAFAQRVGIRMLDAEGLHAWQEGRHNAAPWN